MEGMSHSSCGSCLSDSASSGSLSDSSGGSIYSAFVGANGGTAYVLQERSTLECAILEAIGYALGEGKTSPDKRPDYSKEYVSIAIRYDDQSKPLGRPYDSSHGSGSIDGKMNYSRSVGDEDARSRSVVEYGRGREGDNFLGLKMYEREKESRFR